MRMEIKDDKCRWNEVAARKGTWVLWDFNSRSTRDSVDTWGGREASRRAVATFSQKRHWISKCIITLASFDGSRWLVMSTRNLAPLSRRYRLIFDQSDMSRAWLQKCHDKPSIPPSTESEIDLIDARIWVYLCCQDGNRTSETFIKYFTAVTKKKNAFSSLILQKLLNGTIIQMELQIELWNRKNRTIRI